MAKSRTRKKQRRSGKGSVTQSPVAVLRPAVPYMIVGWLLSVFTTLACEVITVLCWIAQATWGGPRIELFGGLVLFAALVIGLLSMAMLAILWRSHVQQLPRAIVVAAVIIAILPIGLMAIQAFQVE